MAQVITIGMLLACGESYFQAGRVEAPLIPWVQLEMESGGGTSPEEIDSSPSTPLLSPVTAVVPKTKKTATRCTTVVPLLRQKNIPEYIVQRAEIILNSMNPISHRGTKLAKLLFFLTYCAHKELDIRPDVVALRATFGLTRGKVQGISSMFSPLKTGYIPIMAGLTAAKIIPSQCRGMGFDEDTAIAVVRFTAKLVDGSTLLQNANLTTVAAACLYYYIVQHGSVYEPAQLKAKIAAATGRSFATINGMYQQVIMLDNGN